MSWRKVGISCDLRGSGLAIFSNRGMMQVMKRFYLFLFSTAFLIYILIFVFFSGCASKVIEDESRLTSIEAHYPSIELVGCGRGTELGLKVCSRTDELKVRAFYKGRLSIQGCGVGRYITVTSASFVDAELGNIEVDESCVLGFTFQPDIDIPGVKVSGVHGYALVANSRDQIDEVRTFKKIKTASQFVTFKVTEPAIIRLVGVGGRIERRVVTPGDIVIDVTDLLPDFLGVTSIRGYIDTLSERRSIYILGTQYDDRFVPLEIPEMRLGKADLTLVGARGVVAVSIDDAVKIGQTATFPFDRSSSHTVRMGTTKGRQVLGVWDENGGGMTWMQ